jgi:hypothetical protein
LFEDETERLPRHVSKKKKNVPNNIALRPPEVRISQNTRYYFACIVDVFFFLDNIKADVASKQQTTALFLSTMVTRTRRFTELTKKLTNLMGNLCCAREHSVQLLVRVFYTVNLLSLT